MSAGKKALRENNLRRLRACKLCIIAAKDTEAEAFVEELSLTRRIEGEDVDDIARGHFFDLGEFDVGGKKLQYYVTNATRQGIQSFATQAASLFSLLKPKLAVHIGACAAIANHGIVPEDVIFGSRALNYEEGKWTTAETFNADHNICSARGGEVARFIAAKRQEGYKHGDYISGCAVRMDADHIIARVKQASLRDVKALDMEASAFFQVCTYLNINGLAVIKGVTDMGDKYKGVGHERHYRPALRKTALATRRFLEYVLGEPDVDLEIGEVQPGVVIASGYFENFVKKAIDRIVSARCLVLVDPTIEVRVKGFLIVLPKDNNVLKYRSLGLTFGRHDIKEAVLISADLGVRSSLINIKGSFVVDFPTTLTSLQSQSNVSGQVELFKQALQGHLNDYGSGELAEIVTWEGFEERCQELSTSSASTVAGAGR